MNRKLLPFVICALVSPGVVYGASAVAIARRAQDADKRVSYRGTKAICVCVNGKTSCSAVKVVHMRPDKTRKEYSTPAECAGMVVIQDGPDTWRYDPRDRSWEQVHSAPLAPERPGRGSALDNYDVQLVGSEKVAGRDAYVIKAVPKHAGDSLHKVWVDKKCYLTLGTQVQTATGTVLSSSKFTSIAIGPRGISPSAFAVTGKVRNASVPTCVDFVVRKPSYLPRGYTMVGRANVTVSSHCCAHLQFSNGVNTISLFERRCSRECAAECEPRKLATMMTWENAGVHFTLIGDISRAELRRIAASVK